MYNKEESLLKHTKFWLTVYNVHVGLRFSNKVIFLLQIVWSIILKRYYYNCDVNKFINGLCRLTWIGCVKCTMIVARVSSYLAYRRNISICGLAEKRKRKMWNIIIDNSKLATAVAWNVSAINKKLHMWNNVALYMYLPLPRSHLW